MLKFSLTNYAMKCWCCQSFFSGALLINLVTVICGQYAHGTLVHGVRLGSEFRCLTEKVPAASLPELLYRVPSINGMTLPWINGICSVY
jgi:hypothetical protein